MKYWLITRSAVTATDADKMCLWSTAGTPKPLGQAPADTLKNFDASKFLRADHSR